MLEYLKVPVDDKFQVLTRYAESQIVKPKSYQRIEYSDQLIIIQITLNEGRHTDVKKAFHAKVAHSLHSLLNIRKGGYPDQSGRGKQRELVFR